MSKIKIMFKKIFIGIAILFAVYFVLCFVGPKRWEASVTKTISGSPSMVYYQIADFKNWSKWSPWMREDTTIKLTYGAASSGVGGSYSWTSKNSGNGNMIFTSQILNESVHADLKFVDLDMTNDMMIQLKPNGEFTDVTWSMMSKAETPFIQRGIQFIMGFFYDIKNDFNKGLNYLEEVVKNGGAGFAINNYVVQESKFNGNHYLIKRANVSFTQLPSFFETNFAKLYAAAGKNAKQPSSGIIFKWDNATQTADIATAVPLSTKEVSKGEFEIYTINACKDIYTEHYGSFEKTYLAYIALDSVMKSKNIIPSLILEEYITDPKVEPDTNKWLSKVHYLMIEK
jgi:effector-binding domain-containing protein